MSKFKNKIDSELCYLHATDSASDIISKAESKTKADAEVKAAAQKAEAKTDARESKTNKEKK